VEDFFVALAVGVLLWAALVCIQALARRRHGGGK